MGWPEAEGEGAVFFEATMRQRTKAARTRTMKAETGTRTFVRRNLTVISFDVRAFLLRMIRSVVGRPCSILPSSAPSSAAL